MSRRRLMRCSLRLPHACHPQPAASRTLPRPARDTRRHPALRSCRLDARCGRRRQLPLHAARASRDSACAIRLELPGDGPRAPGGSRGAFCPEVRGGNGASRARIRSPARACLRPCRRRPPGRRGRQCPRRPDVQAQRCRQRDRWRNCSAGPRSDRRSLSPPGIRQCIRAPRCYSQALDGNRGGRQESDARYFEIPAKDPDRARRRREWRVLRSTGVPRDLRRQRGRRGRLEEPGGGGKAQKRIASSPLSPCSQESRDRRC